MTTAAIPCFFHPEQLSFRPLYEWAFGNKIEHPERTERADKILAALQAEPSRFSVRKPEAQDIHIMAKQHAPRLLRLYDTAAALSPKETYYPTVFLPRDWVDPDPTVIHHAGYFCFDAGTPLSSRVRDAALWSAASARSAATLVLEGETRLAYALSRPPGHHAGYDMFGGYCYFNNSAAAANVLRKAGKVAILDIDVHHGNGTQSLFYNDGGILTMSIHSDPSDTFPYFAGFASEHGAGSGVDCNLNVPLPRGTDGQEYDKVMSKTVIPHLSSFEASALVVAAGVDAYYEDPVGTFELSTDDFHRIGERIGSLRLPTCVVQEGGYYTPAIGKNVTAVLEGIREGMR